MSKILGRQAKGLSLVLVGAVLLALIPMCFAADRSPEEERVWQMEEQYWRYVKAADTEGYLTLWHQNFVGVPCGKIPRRRAYRTERFSGGHGHQRAVANDRL
jgi:hypothetical protein